MLHSGDFTTQREHFWHSKNLPKNSSVFGAFSRTHHKTKGCKYLMVVAFYISRKNHVYRSFSRLKISCFLPLHWFCGNSQEAIFRNVCARPRKMHTKLCIFCGFLKSLPVDRFNPLNSRRFIKKRRVSYCAHNFHSFYLKKSCLVINHFTNGKCSLENCVLSVMKIAR